MSIEVFQQDVVPLLWNSFL